MSKKISEFCYNDKYNLPYEYGALSPFISETTNRFHYEHHFMQYIETLANELKARDMFLTDTLSTIIEKTYGRVDYIEIYNCASQIHLHMLFWESLSPKEQDKNTISSLTQKFFDESDLLNSSIADECVHQAKQLFGNGWLFIALDTNDKIIVFTTVNAFNPLNMEHVKAVLVAIDLWEHSYFLDYQTKTKKVDYVRILLQNIINWKRVHNILLSCTV